jgi:tetratricopeptide (TPR) repeat protein
MNRNPIRKRPVALLVVLVYAFGPSAGFLAPAVAWAQASADKPVQRGEGYYEQSRFDEAISLLKDLVTNNSLSGPDLERAREILARSYVKKGYPVQAKEMFKEILRANPDWRPDPIRVPPDESAIFEEALREFQSGVTPPPQPSTTGTSTPKTAENAPPITTPMETKSSKKGLFSKWYFYAGLAAVGAGAALALGGGGSDDGGGTGGEPLPAFPAHP